MQALVSMECNLLEMTGYHSNVITGQSHPYKNFALLAGGPHFSNYQLINLQLSAMLIG